MSTKNNNRKKTFYLKSAVAAIVLSFVFGIFSGLESNALLDLNRVFTVSGRDGIRELGMMIDVILLQVL